MPQRKFHCARTCAFDRIRWPSVENAPAGGTLWRFCGETREAFVMESQHSDSFNSERPDSPNNAAIAAEISFSHFLSYC
jgi:hypothetical protein